MGNPDQDEVGLDWKGLARSKQTLPVFFDTVCGTGISDGDM
jgi:hypothetical protein